MIAVIDLGIVVALLGLGNVARGTGQSNKAIAAYQQCLGLADGSAKMASESGQRQREDVQRRSEAIALVALGDAEEVLACWLRSLMVFAQLGLLSRTRTVVTAIYGHLLQVVDADFWQRPVTAVRISQVLAEPLEEIEQDYGKNAVASVVRCLVEAETD